MTKHVRTRLTLLTGGVFVSAAIALLGARQPAGLGAAQSEAAIILQSFRQVWVPPILLQMNPGAQAAEESHGAPSVPVRVCSLQPQSGLSCPIVESV